MIVCITIILCMLLFQISIAIAYFSKERVNTVDNRLYSKLLIITLIGLIIELLCYGTIINMEKSDVLRFMALAVNKIFIIYLLIWEFVFTAYVIYISFSDSQKIVDLVNRKYKNINTILLSAICIISLLLICLPLKLYNDGSYIYSSGIGTDLLTILGGIFILVDIYCLLRNIKHIVHRKYIPLIILILLMIVVVTLRILNPGLTVINSCFALVTIIMYFTIENPDAKMIQALEVAREQAVQANRAKTEFLSSMSHEIRTPLNAIVGFSGEILEAKNLDEAQTNAKDIVHASETLLEIVNGILDISKIESGKVEITNSPYNSRELFEELARLITPKMEEKGLDFTCTIAPDLPGTLFGDHSNLKKVVTNLLSNACKYTEKGFVHYEVNCVNTNNICKLIISVEDSGRGIKRENVDQLFTQFQRLEEDRNTTIEGTGLGLAITKQLIELMGGRVILHTVYGQGSKFTVVLNQRIETVQVQEKKKVDTKINLKGVKLLLVDDTPLNLKVASKLLERHGADNITTVSSGFECLDRIKAGERYDIILMDDMMPKLSGTETLHQLKELVGFKTPVVALTANAITGMREKYLAEGFNDYLAKPIDKEQLVVVLSQILGKKGIEEEEPTPVPVEEEKEVSEEDKNKDSGEEKTEEEKEADKKSEVIPVEENIEEILGDQLDMNYDEERVKMNNNNEESNIEKEGISETGTTRIVITGGGNMTETVENNNVEEVKDVAPAVAPVASIEPAAEPVAEAAPATEEVTTAAEVTPIEPVASSVEPIANVEPVQEEKVEESAPAEPVAEPAPAAEPAQTEESTVTVAPPEEVAPMEDPLNNDSAESAPVAEGVYDRSYLEANGVDVEHGLELLGDMEMYNDTMKDFVSEVETKWADIVKYKEENNMPEYAILVHSLKSDCKYLGFMDLADIAYQHELKSKENDSAFVNDNFAPLEEKYKKVLEIAKEYVNHNN